mmetsp:Transcript_23540/g.49700  ORF Transcript_23540/g.49700 Transcript_23540/m.49700 type:complete len:461 (-) Transcript_23540:21-1403(-)
MMYDRMIVSKMTLPEKKLISICKWIGGNVLFSELLESDQRSPLITFQIPELITKFLGMGSGKLGVVAPSIQFWLAIAVILAIWILVSLVISLVSYHFIILPRKLRKKSDDNKSEDIFEITPYLIGFGLLMPFCVMFPFYEVKYFNIQNKVIRFICTLGPITAFFRVSEAMFGFMPAHTVDSVSNTMIYIAVPVEVKFNNMGPMKSSWGDAKGNLIKFGAFMLLLGAYSSFLSDYSYEPFPTGSGSNLEDINLGNGFSRGQLINNALAAILFQLYLTTFGYGITTLTSLGGVQQLPMMLNPIFESKSPSDFWGRKWNLVVHGLLKRGVYKPVRTRFSRMTASTATFIASGIFHEWILAVLFSPEYNELEGDACIPPSCYRPGFGRSTLFFIWNAIIIAMEYLIGGAAIFQLAKRHLPSVIVSILVSSLGLPMGHWFMNDYVRSDYFEDGQLGFPLVVRVPG